MNISDYISLMTELGFINVERAKKLRHPSNPPSLYLNWKRNGDVYFTTYKVNNLLFPDGLWARMSPQQKKDARPELITLLPADGQEREALQDFLRRAEQSQIVDAVGKPSGIPAGITRSDVESAIQDIEAGVVQDGFGESRLWDVLYDGRLYPPKRVIGVAARRVAGRVLLPAEFSGGEESKCHDILDALNFRIVPKGEAWETDPLEDARVEADIRARRDIPETKRKQLIEARRGQGRFRRDVAAVEKGGCRVTGVREIGHLRASHIKPWSISTDHERLDGHNGLLLSPHIDHLFDGGHISFMDDGGLMISKFLPATVLTAWALERKIQHRSFTTDQRRYLEYHRQEVFERTRKKKG